MDLHPKAVDKLQMGLVYKGKLLELAVLIEQAKSNTKERFANSPALAKEMVNAIMDAQLRTGR